MSVAQLTWIDLTAADREKVRRVLNLFNEQGTVDELGLGTLRDALSNALFPGTSVLHTRMRYALFIPWIYQLLEARSPGHDVTTEARRLEMQLIDALSEDEGAVGVIGKLARQSLAQLASSSYWAALVHWGLFIPGKSQGWYHTHFDALIRRRSDIPRADDPGVIWSREPTWHPRLPPMPKRFPTEVSFALTSDEADFLLGRLEERCSGTLLAWLALEGSADLAQSPWDEPAARAADAPIRDILDLARRFSLHVEGAPLLYNLYLGELRHALLKSQKDKELIERYRGAIAKWATDEAAEETFQPGTLWQLVLQRGGRIPLLQQRFVEAWSHRLAEIGPAAIVDDPQLRELIAKRERQLKGDQRARVTSRSRLLDWGGEVGVGRMRFRWPQVRQLLIDLHQGLVR